MGPSVGIDYEGQISSRLTFVLKGVLVIMQGYTKVSEQGLQIWLIDELISLIGLINQLGPILDQIK